MIFIFEEHEKNRSSYFCRLLRLQLQGPKLSALVYQFHLSSPQVFFMEQKTIQQDPLLKMYKSNDLISAWFQDELIPVEIKGKRGKPSTFVLEDEEYTKANFDKFRKLKQAYILMTIKHGEILESECNPDLLTRKKSY